MGEPCCSTKRLVLSAAGDGDKVVDEKKLRGQLLAEDTGPLPLYSSEDEQGVLPRDGAQSHPTRSLRSCRGAPPQITHCLVTGRPRG